MFWKTQERYVDPNTLVPLSYGINRNQPGVTDSIFFICVSVNGGPYVMYKHWETLTSGNVGVQNPWAANYDAAYPGFSTSGLVLGENNLDISGYLNGIDNGKAGTLKFRLSVGNKLPSGKWAITSEHYYTLDVIGTGAGVTPTIVPGDINGDGVFDLDDVFALYPYVVSGLVGGKINADQIAAFEATGYALTNTGANKGIVDLDDVYNLYKAYITSLLNP